MDIFLKKFNVIYRKDYDETSNGTPFVNVYYMGTKKWGFLTEDGLDFEFSRSRIPCRLATGVIGIKLVHEIPILGWIHMHVNQF